jgi:hypothetical protein
MYILVKFEKIKKILKIWSLLQKWSGPIGGDLYRDDTSNNTWPGSGW